MPCYARAMARSMRKAEPAAPPLDPVAQAILAALHDCVQARGATASLSLPDVARTIAESRRRRGDPPDLWRRYLTAVRQQALFLARRGEVCLLRRGEPVPPDHVKGVVRLALPRPRT